MSFCFLNIGRVAYAYGTGILIAGKMTENFFFQIFFTPDPVHDLYILVFSFVNGEQEVQKALCRNEMAGIDQYLDYHRGIANPAVPVIPVTFFAYCFGY